MPRVDLLDALEELDEADEIQGEVEAQYALKKAEQEQKKKSTQAPDSLGEDG